VSYLDKLKAPAFTLLFDRESNDPLNAHPRSCLETGRNLYGLSYLGEARIRGDIQVTIADPISGAIIRKYSQSNRSANKVGELDIHTVIMDFSERRS